MDKEASDFPQEKEYSPNKKNDMVLCQIEAETFIERKRKKELETTCKSIVPIKKKKTLTKPKLMTDRSAMFTI